ncbi:2-oxoacid:acceptor oxidoreductase family protein, partial [Candidatus Calescamantes bacterium]|nr:2-oxoacid:acceptor oxidoreductase family protein [Candidatus Calescamantes bacterium]
SLLQNIDFGEELKDNGTILINTDNSVEEIRSKIKLGNKNAKVYTIDATGISVKVLGKNIPNIAILGAFSKITGLIELEEVKIHIHEKLMTKYGKDIINKNIEALEAAYKEVEK